MAKITLEHQDEILTFPKDTILELKIEEVTIETIKSQRGTGDWQSANFKFKILGIQALGDGGDPKPYENWITRNIYGSVPWNLTDSAENRLRIWAEAIFRTELGEGFELDSDMFLGRSVRGITMQYEKAGGGRDQYGKPFMRAKIDTLLPWGGDGTQVSAPNTTTAPPAARWSAQPNVNAAASAAAPANDPWAVPAGGYGDEPPF